MIYLFLLVKITVPLDMPVMIRLLWAFPTHLNIVANIVGVGHCSLAQHVWTLVVSAFVITLRFLIMMLLSDLGSE